MKRALNEMTKAFSNTRSSASPASVAMKAGGVASIRCVNRGAKSPNSRASMPTSTAPVYCRAGSPPLDRMALTGPVKQVETVPVTAVTNEVTPQAVVIILTGGRWPLAVRMAMPWAFCAASTVTASGITSSTMAGHEKTGAKTTGRAIITALPISGAKRPLAQTAMIPTSNTPIIGGSRRAMAGCIDNKKNAAVIGMAIQKSPPSAASHSNPKRRNTPATMAMTMGIGSNTMIRRTQPLRPSTNNNSPVA